MLVNCQFDGRAHEDQPGFTLTLPKAVLLYQWVQSVGDFAAREVERDVCAIATSAAPLAFEAAANAHFDILFNDSAATSYRSEFRN